MLVRCDGYKYCKGKHIAYEKGCPHSKFHECEVSDCVGYCGNTDKFVMCEKPSRKEKLEKLEKIGNDNRYKSR